MTLNGHSTLNFHCYELPMRVSIYSFSLLKSLFTYKRDQWRCAEAQKRFVICRIFGIRGKTADLS